MGYRERLSKLPKEISERFRDIESYEELNKVLGFDKEKDEYFHSFKEEKELLYLMTSINEDDKEVEDFFNKFSYNEYSGNRYQVLSKEGLKKIIEQYDDEIVAYMDECLENEKKSPGLIHSFAERKRDYWRMDRFGNSDFAAKMKPYILKTEDKDLEDNDGQIVSLPYMEYQIFNVVFIYNTFDWDKYDLILTGW
jgi:spore coat polysaccharide biosynthesis protein SpsF (cytidylyltransferase family)